MTYPNPYGLMPYMGTMHLGAGPQMNLAGMHLGYDPTPVAYGSPVRDELSLGAAGHPAHHPMAHHGNPAAHLENIRLQHAMAEMAKLQALQSKAMTHLQPTEQTQVLPFPKGEGGSTSVLAGALATVSARPQRPFQTQRFAWPSTTSGFFDIILFTVGQENMMVQAGAVSAEIFAQTGVGVGLSGYIAYPGIEITLQVQNTDTVAHPIQAAIVGSALV
jgi:hypothetical protein